MPEFLILILRRKYVIIKIKILSGNLRVFAIIGNYSREKPVVWSQKSSASKPVLNLDPPQIFFYKWTKFDEKFDPNLVLITKCFIISDLFSSQKWVGSWVFPYRLTLKYLVNMLISWSSQNISRLVGC